jgi:hypothetical protein
MPPQENLRPLVPVQTYVGLAPALVGEKFAGVPYAKYFVDSES